MNTSYKKLASKVPKKLRTRKTIVFVIAAILAFNILTRGSADTKQIKLASAQTKTLTSTVSASGVVKSSSQATLKFSNSGKIAAIYVKEGDFVKKYQKIASLDVVKLEADVRQAEQEVVATDAILSQVYDEQKKQTAAENFDQKIRRTTAETNKNQAYDNLQKTQKALLDATIHAPFSGTIATLNVVVGEEVAATTEVGMLVDLENIVFVSEVDETDVAKTQKNQKATVTLDAFENEQIETSVKKIGAAAVTTSAGATAYEIEFDLPKTHPFRLGMNGEAEIVTQKAENVLTIPVEALADPKYVWVKENSHYIKKEIETGVQSDIEIEIAEGLTEGETVVTSGFSELNKKSLLDRILRR
ncbi:efflux RND transporter periplasmic adaptor subunit [Candidatus Curtissbacteria bacterium]|nr:efflux RND transporter periplasmic adaptor subunit [Candidatus Curtissbacteria bacterium]